MYYYVKRNTRKSTLLQKLSPAVVAIVFPIQNQGKWILRKHNKQNYFLLIFASYCSNFEQQNVEQEENKYEKKKNPDNGCRGKGLS